MFDLSPEFAPLVQQRLENEEILWFTSVTPNGVPNTNPVWFHWDGEFITVYSQPSSWRVRNLRDNPNVALHFQGVDGAGNNVVVINGRAVLDTGNHTIPQAYWDKYARYLSEVSLTREEMMGDYSIRIRVKPEKVRGE